ncbi:MAG: response regulator [Chloroflexi bacterium]|nr:response regulator [Chloroflexota bacterium]
MTDMDSVKQWTVLVVDDEPDNIGVVEKLLTFYGAKVWTASNGMQALQILNEITPSFILLDLSMSVMDGWETLKAIQAQQKLAQVPVIALTAHAMSGDLERVQAAGFNGYIPKPLRLATFLMDIRQCLAGGQGRTTDEFRSVESAPR